MKNKIPKIITDILMLATQIATLATMRGNMVAHTVVGFSFLFFMIVHTCLNRKWLKGITKRFLKVKPKIKAQYIISVLLTALWLAVAITAVLALVGLHGVRRMHGILGAVSSVFTLVHIILHHKRIVAFFKRKQGQKEDGAQHTVAE
ncbi:MAG: hypothetical protein FWD49_00150 [Firmicutes bacterium]|nr:hypothetical protein [Bacillota bacterium]